jgi:phosphoglycerate dehydrogenase-like enzyme
MVYRPLGDLLREADVISIHLAGTKETAGFIGRAEIAAMKRSAILVNTARGSIVDEEALVEALKGGRIRGAGLDVFRDEPLPVAHPLTLLENVVLTPHVAARGVAWDTLGALFANFGRVLRGIPPTDVIN